VYTSLALDGTGFPVIGIRVGASANDLRLVHCNDPNCAGDDESVNDIDSEGDVGWYPSLALDSSGYPVISYYDNTNKTLKLAYCNDPNCTGDDETIVVVDDSGAYAVGWHSSIVLDSFGFPVISYYDLPPTGDLKLAHCGNPHCNQEMDILGNGISIADGDTAPSLADHTDFGDTVVEGGTSIRTFTIDNIGIGDLTLTDSPRVTLSGPDVADFTLTSDASTLISTGSQTTFQVTFNPSALGIRQATISIANNDTDENPYNFSIQGTGTVQLFLPLIKR
jgi:hypothetical protein